MISIIITSYKEPKTIGRAIERFLNQGLDDLDYEILVSAPDRETLESASKYMLENERVKLVMDDGKGKPAALNHLFKIAKGEILVLSDGDVYVSENSVKELLKYFKDKKVGAVTGRPISINDRNSLFGYWAYLLTKGFHNLRKNESNKNKDILCSGYFYAVRKNLVRNIPEDILADDAFISMNVIKQGYKIVYEPKAEVHVKYPITLPDWIRQKKRTAGRFYQLKRYFKVSKTSSFREEVISGIKNIYEIENFKHLFWYLLLVVMRFYIWFRIFFDLRLWNRSFKKTWERVESTK